MATISIELAEKMIGKFDGNKSKIFEFTDNCDKAYALVKDELKPILFTIIETRIVDTARALIRSRSFNNWPSLREYLIEAYSEKRTAGQWQLELSSCKQNQHENVMLFANRLEHCYIKLIASLNSDLTAEAKKACTELLKDQAKTVFINGLNSELSLIVKSQKPTSLEDAISVALAEEQQQKSKAEIQKFQYANELSVKYCTICKKPGHSNFQCYSRQKSFGRESNIRQFNYDKPRPTFEQNFSRQSFQSTSCAYCKKIGHLINDCRKRQFNNQMRQQNSNSSPNYQQRFQQKGNNNQHYNQPNDSSKQGNSKQGHYSKNYPGPQMAATSRTAHLIQAESQ